MRRKEPVTLTDVAIAAAVSQSTVSRVLNKHPRISSITRSRVLRTIEELGYDTSGIDRRQMSRGAAAAPAVMNIEFVLCPLAEQKNMLSLEYFSTVFDNVQTYFSRTGNVNLRLCSWGRESEREPVFRRLELADGVLVSGAPDADLLGRLAEAKIRTVLISCGPENAVCDVVGSDNFSGGAEAANYLIDRGLTRIGFLNCPRIEEWNSRLMGAMLTVVRRCGVNCFESREAASTSLSDVAGLLQKWFAEPDHPEALILPYAAAFPAAEMALRENNLVCPNDVSVISFAEGGVDSFHTVLTCFNIHPDRIGRKAAQRLMQLIGNPGETPHRVSVPLELVEGNSVRQQ